MHSATQALEPPLPYEVLQHEGEGRDLHKRRGRSIGPKQIYRLAWAARLGCGTDERRQTMIINAAISVHDDKDIGRRSFELFDGECERVTLAASRRINSFNHLAARIP